MGNFRAHNTKNYERIKRLQLFIREKGSTGPWESVGSVKDVTARVEQDILEHFSNYLDDRVKDAEEIFSRRCQIDFTFEEFNSLNYKHALGHGFAASTDGVKDVLYEKTKTNPGAPGAVVDLGVEDIKNLAIRSVTHEDDVTYVEGNFDTDTTETTGGGSFNTTTTITIAVADYPGITFAVGQYLKVENEILRVSAVSGGNATLQRAQLGTTAAVHADDVAIYEGTDGDYIADLTNGKVAILLGGDLEDDVAIKEFHASFQKELQVEEFDLFPGRLIECEVQLQYGKADQIEKVWGPIMNAVLKNNGDIAIGDGSDWAGIPMRIEGFASQEGEFGTAGIVKANQS